MLTAAQQFTSAGAAEAVQALQHLGCHHHVLTYVAGLPSEQSIGAEHIKLWLLDLKRS